MEEKLFLVSSVRVVGLRIMIIITNLALAAQKRNKNLTFMKVKDNNRRWTKSVATSGIFSGMIFRCVTKVCY
jgi:hypothetical protein